MDAFQIDTWLWKYYNIIAHVGCFGKKNIQSDALKAELLFLIHAFLSFPISPTVTWLQLRMQEEVLWVHLFLANSRRFISWLKWCHSWQFSIFPVLIIHYCRCVSAFGATVIFHIQYPYRAMSSRAVKRQWNPPEFPDNRSHKPQNMAQKINNKHMTGPSEQ